MNALKNVAIGVCGMVAVGAMLAGCAGRPTLIPNSDPNLRRTSAQFAADAAKRHPYPSSLPRGGTAVAQVEPLYTLDAINLVNLSDEDWSDVEIWVNRKYVVYVPSIPKNKLETVNFQMIYDDEGNYFPRDNRKTRVETVEVRLHEKMYDVPVRLPQ